MVTLNINIISIMKKSILLLSAMAVLTAFCFVACSDDEKTDSSSRTPALISGKVYTFDPEEPAESWKAKQTIGVFMLKANTSTIIDDYSNMLYKATIAESNDYFTTTPEGVVYYPDNGEKVDIVAYYPRQEVLTDNTYTVNVSNQKSPATMDLLYANNTKGLNKDNPRADMVIKHVLTKLIFEFTAGDNVVESDLEGISVKVTGMPTVAIFDLLAGNFNAGTSVADIDLLATEEGYGAEGIVLPASSTAGYQVEYYLPSIDKTFTWNIFDDVASLEGSKQYTFGVTVNGDNVVVKVDSSSITDWGKGNGSGEDITVKQ